MPERLDAEYVGEDGMRHRPVMLHRAILGSFERFLGILIEHYAGRFPLWLAPVQLAVATIVSDADEFACEAARAFRQAGLEVAVDLSNQKIAAKVRGHSLAHVPVLAVVGRREAESGTVALRRLGADAQEVLSLAAAVVRLAAEATAPDLKRSGQAAPEFARSGTAGSARLLPEGHAEPTTIGEHHSTRTTARPAHARRAASERRDSSTAGAAD